MSISNKKVMIMGDVHAMFGTLNEIINKRKPEVILCCGDFGYWPKQYPIDMIKPQDTQIYFCDGNHEDHNELAKIEGNEIIKNVFYMRRGTITNFPWCSELGNILFMGGADSVDKHMRTLGIDWFPDELITQEDLDRIPEDAQIDTVISHTCPEEFPMKGNLEWGGKINDPSRMALSIILKKYKPKRWYFGHWHHWATGQYVHPKKDNVTSEQVTKWYGLSMLPCVNSWIWF